MLGIDIDNYNHLLTETENARQRYEAATKQASVSRAFKLQQAANESKSIEELQSIKLELEKIEKALWTYKGNIDPDQLFLAILAAKATINDIDERIRKLRQQRSY